MKSGATAQPIDGIGRVGLSAVEMRAGRGSQVTSCRKAQDADLGGIDLPVTGVRTNQANRALCVGERRGMAVTGAAATMPIFERECGNTERIEPLGHVVPLVAHH